MRQLSLVFPMIFTRSQVLVVISGMMILCFQMSSMCRTVLKSIKLISSEYNTGIHIHHLFHSQMRNFVKKSNSGSPTQYTNYVSISVKMGDFLFEKLPIFHGAPTYSLNISICTCSMQVFFCSCPQIPKKWI